jgi:hypothetical protein
MSFVLGVSCDKRRAADRPAKPPPITSQSAVISLFKGCGGLSSGSIAFQPDMPGLCGRFLVVILLIMNGKTQMANYDENTIMYLHRAVNIFHLIRSFFGYL